MYVTQTEWQKALVQWMNEMPTLTNGKQFIVFESGEPTPDSFMFEGDLLEFADMYFSAKEWPEVVAFVKEFGYTVVVEDDDRWDEITLMLEEAEEPDYEDDRYDEHGNVSPGGIYDAGGHADHERYLEWADDVYDRKRGK